jgi:hypothetical protein
MTVPPFAVPRVSPWLLPATLLAANLLVPRLLPAAEPDSLPPPAAAAESSTASLAPDAEALTRLGFENVSVDPAGRWIAYENRRYRQSAEARGRALAALAPRRGVPLVVYERRLGLVVAAVEDTGGAVPASLLYPSDRAFSGPPAGPRLEPTSRSVDLEVAPLFSYELGRIMDPVLVRIEMETRLRYNPWRGARATASMIIPLRNDFPPDSVRPDINRVRPGLMTLEQFAWVDGIGLVSGTAGLLGSNRYGVSVGAARPLAQGAFLLDAQADLTGYIAFPGGMEYSGLSRWTAFGGVTWRAPSLDLAVRVRGARYLYADQGAEIEVRRSMGNLDLAFFYQRTGGLDVRGVRALLPIPPIVRPTGGRIRVLPIERMPLDYRDEVEPAGRSIRGVASREDFLRQLNARSLAAHADRYREGRGEPRPEAAREAPDWVSLTGMTGFVNTPWCGVIADRGVELGYNQVPKEAAYDHRGSYRNDVYYAALGFLPRTEAGLRWTVIPGLKAFTDIIPDSRLTDSDRMLSGRIELLAPRPKRPGLAIGIEDALGTRRFHSTYAVTGIPFEYQWLRSRVSLGYASRVLTAGRRTLDGAFGAFDVTVARTLVAGLEYDTEKINGSLGFGLGIGLRGRVVLLDVKHLGFGAGWAVSL